jgi:hypothetical protein
MVTITGTSILFPLFEKAFIRQKAPKGYNNIPAEFSTK